MKARWILGLASMLWAVGPGVALSQCPKEMLVDGIELERCAEFAVLRVDLAAEELAVRVSRSSQRGTTVEEWAEAETGIVAAVQGGPFFFPAYEPRGLTIGEGEAWSETRDSGQLAVLGFDSRGVPVFVPETQLVPLESWMHSVISGERLVRDGVAITECEADSCIRGPRTGMGPTEDGRFLIVVVARFMTDPELAAQLVESGAHGALRTGRGATSALYTPSEMVVPSSDGASRPAAAFLGFQSRASGSMTRLRGVVGDAANDELFYPDAQLSVESFDGREVTTGTPRTEGGYWEFSLPVRGYIVRASRPGFRTGCKICPGVVDMDVWCSIFLTAGEGADTCTPPARVLDVGPWPEAPDEPDAGGGDDAGVDAADAGGGGGAGRCSTSAPGSGPAPPLIALAFGLAVVARRLR